MPAIREEYLAGFDLSDLTFADRGLLLKKSGRKAIVCNATDDIPIGVLHYLNPFAIQDTGRQGGNAIDIQKSSRHHVRAGEALSDDDWIGPGSDGRAVVATDWAIGQVVGAWAEDEYAEVVFFPRPVAVSGGGGGGSGGPPITVDTSLPALADAEKDEFYATSEDDDDGLTSAANIKREGHVSILTLRSDYLGNNRSGFLHQGEDGSHRGGSFVGGTPVGLEAVVVEDVDFNHDRIYIEGRTDGDGGLANFVSDNASGTLKIRYRRAGHTNWAHTIALPNTSTPRSNVKRWRSDSLSDDITDSPLGTTVSGQEKLWEMEILNASDDSVIEMAEGTRFEGIDEEFLNSEFEDQWTRIVAYVAEQLNYTIQDVTGSHPPALTENTYKRIFVDYDIPRIWMGWKDYHAETDPTGTWAEWTHSRFEGVRSSDGSASSSNYDHFYYNNSAHHWRIVGRRSNLLSPGFSYHWANFNIEQYQQSTLNIDWLGERDNRTDALLQIASHDSTKTYLFYNKATGDVETLDDATYVAGDGEYTTYDLITIFARRTSGEAVETVLEDEAVDWTGNTDDTASDDVFSLTRNLTEDDRGKLVLVDMRLGGTGGSDSRIGFPPILADYILDLPRADWTAETAVSNTVSGISFFGPRVADIGATSPATWGLFRTGEIATTLSVALLSTATSMTVADGTALEVDAEYYIDDELILVTEISDNTITIERAKGGTTAASHSASENIHADDFKGFFMKRSNTGQADIAALSIHLVDLAGIASSATGTAGGDAQAGEQSGVTSANGTVTEKLYRAVNDDVGIGSVSDPPNIWDSTEEEFNNDFSPWSRTVPTVGSSQVLAVANGASVLDEDSVRQNIAWQKFFSLTEQYAVDIQDSSTWTFDDTADDLRFSRSLLADGWSAWRRLADGQGGWIDLITREDNWVANVSSGAITHNLPGAGFDARWFFEIEFEIEVFGFSSDVEYPGGRAQYRHRRTTGNWTNKFDANSNAMELGVYKLRYQDLQGLGLVQSSGRDLSRSQSTPQGTAADEPDRRFDWELSLIGDSASDPNMITHIRCHDFTLSNGFNRLSVRMR